MTAVGMHQHKGAVPKLKQGEFLAAKTVICGTFQPKLHGKQRDPLVIGIAFVFLIDDNIVFSKIGFAIIENSLKRNMGVLYRVFRDQIRYFSAHAANQKLNFTGVSAVGGKLFHHTVQIPEYRVKGLLKDAIAYAMYNRAKTAGVGTISKLQEEMIFEKDLTGRVKF